MNLLRVNEMGSRVMFNIVRMGSYAFESFEMVIRLLLEK